MTSACPITEEEISALVDGELVGREERRVAAHVAVCAECSVRAGALFAGKRLLAIRSHAIEPPHALWDHLVASLDEVDGMARASVTGAPRRGSRPWGSAPALAGLGCILILAALFWRGVATRDVGHGALFLNAHLAACSRFTDAGVLPNVSDVVAPGFTATTWDPVARNVFSLDGQFVEQTLYRVDHTPISEFVLLARAFDARGLRAVHYNGATYLVSARRCGSVVAWDMAGMMRVLVGRTRPDELLALADTRRATAPPMRAY